MLPNLNPDQLPEVRAQIGYYKKVMLEFGVPSEKFFGSIPLRIEDLQSFIDENPGLAGLRIYLSKETGNAADNNNQVTLVPCELQTDPNGYEFLKDKTGPGGGKIITQACRVPPGCTLGAEFQ